MGRVLTKPLLDIGMKKFIVRSALFVSPFLVCGGVVFLVDPFNFFNFSLLISNDIKRPISNLHYPLWKMPEYRRNPEPNILLGDSRMGALRAEFIEKISGEKYYNFSYGGATLQEIIRTFWFADAITPLRKVYLGVNFNLYNALERGDRTKDYRNLVENPFLYFVNPTVLKATWYDIKAASGANVAIGVPNMGRDAFWKHQLEITARRMYRRHEYPLEYRKELERIAEHCRTNGIQLVFIVFPTHTDLQARVKDFGLEGQRERFRRDLEAIAPTYDFDLSNEFTANFENFKDPFHFKENVMELLVRDVWGNQSVLPANRPSVQKRHGAGR